MRHVLSSSLVLLALSFLGGCAGAKPNVATVSGNVHVSVAMDDATSRALLGDEDDEDGPVGTTMLTNATLDVPPLTAKNAAAVVPPEEQIGEDAPLPIRTWGSTPDIDGIPGARE